MKKPDKFLLGIVAGVVLLVIVVLVVALQRPNQPAYQADDTPEGVVHNYLLALQLKEYERAYGYLSSTLPGYPINVETFEHDVDNHRWNFGYFADDVSLAVEEVNVGGDRADVVVRQTMFYSGGLLDSGQSSSTFNMTLRHEDGTWKLTDSDSYWAGCWDSRSGCK